MLSKLNRWVILTCGLGLALVLGLDYVTEGLKHDATYLSVAILLVFLVAHLHIPMATTNKATAEKLWFAAEVMIAMGLAGTVLGFMLMFGEAFANLDTSSPEAISAVLTDLATGLGVALVTTLTGLLSSFTLKAELVFIVEGD